MPRNSIQELVAFEKPAKCRSNEDSEVFTGTRHIAHDRGPAIDDGDDVLEIMACDDIVLAARMATSFVAKKQAGEMRRIVTPSPISKGSASLIVAGYHSFVNPRTSALVGMMSTLMPSTTQRQSGAPSSRSSLKPRDTSALHNHVPYSVR